MNEWVFAPSLFFCYSLFHIHVKVLKPWASPPMRISCDESFPFPSYSQHSGQRTLPKTPLSFFKSIPISSKTLQRFTVGLHPSFQPPLPLEKLSSCLGVLWVSSLDHSTIITWELVREANSQLASDLFNEEGRSVWNLAACVLTSPPGDSECENRCCYWATWDSLPKTLLLCQLFVFTLSHLAEIPPSFCPFKSCVASKPQVICYLLHRASVESAVGNPSSSSALEWALFCEPFGSSSCTGLYPLFLAHGR